MGAISWYYFVPYQTDINQALQDLRTREFQAGRYYPAVDSLQFPITELSPSFSANYPDIESVFEDAGPTGTRSILDIMSISDSPGICIASPLLLEEKVEYLDTEYPTRGTFEQEGKLRYLLDLVGRGEALYSLVYKGDEPDEILFVGWSFD